MNKKMASCLTLLFSESLLYSINKEGYAKIMFSESLLYSVNREGCAKNMRIMIFSSYWNQHTRAGVKE